MRIIGLLLMIILSYSYPTSQIEAIDKDQSTPIWQQQLANLNWIGFSPTNFDPIQGIEPTPESLHQDLKVLKKAGFDGIITYGSGGKLGHQLPSIAAAEGFYQIIGIWNPLDIEEIAVAKANAKLPHVIALCVGNEGIFTNRYTLEDLYTVIQDLQENLQLPITTTEPLNEYIFNKELQALGDFTFPNAHPIFSAKYDPIEAVEWTLNSYNKLKKRLEKDRFLMFKEVGLPTAGDSEDRLSERYQEEYYRLLKNKNEVIFSYFESFDQAWKKEPKFEAYWGLFDTKRRPKSFANYLISQQSQNYRGIHSRQCLGNDPSDS